MPAVTPELIAEHAAGLVVLLGPASDVGRAVAARRPDQARRLLDRWRSLGCEAVVEIVDHLDHKSTFRAARLAELARDTGTTAVLTNAVRYLDPADSLAAQVLDAARHLVPLGSPRLVPHNGRAYLAGPDDMARVAERVTAAMTGPGGRSAERAAPPGCSPRPTSWPAGAPWTRPATSASAPTTCPRPQGTATSSSGSSAPAASTRSCTAATAPRTASARPRRQPAARRQERPRPPRARAGHHRARPAWPPYFLTVADVADRISAAGIRCAIRGSGAGSFVNHLLGISAIDPLEHDLLMERFLSPVRATLPDIDLDVESARRLDAYRIIFDALRGGAHRLRLHDGDLPGAQRDQGRRRRDVAAARRDRRDREGLPAHPREAHHGRARPSCRSSAAHGSRREQLATIFSIAQQLDGLPRHVAMHPCGVLLSDRTLLDRTAVQASAEGFPLSQLDKDDAEIAGVIKLDVLGVRMQSAMAHTLAEIERTTAEKIDIDAMPRDDEATYAMIGRSETIGCFQIESPGQRELVKKLAPRDVADLIVDISLFRPGPVNSDMIGPFLRTRHGLAEPRYPHEKLREALQETGGVVVFHEQVLRIIDVLTGCGLAEADLVRRHLSTEGGPERTAPWFRAQAWPAASTR